MPLPCRGMILTLGIARAGWASPRSGCCPPGGSPPGDNGPLPTSATTTTHPALLTESDRFGPATRYQGVTSSGDPPRADSWTTHKTTANCERLASCTARPRTPDTETRNDSGPSSNAKGTVKPHTICGTPALTPWTSTTPHCTRPCTSTDCAGSTDHRHITRPCATTIPAASRPELHDVQTALPHLEGPGSNAGIR